MATNYETGHAKNIANFQTLFSYLAGYGAAYNPSKTSLQGQSLLTLLASAEAAMQQVNTLLASTGNAIAAREKAFEPMQALSTRLLNALKATTTTPAIIDNFATHNRKQQGKRAGKKIDPTTTLTDPAQPSPVQISASQQSYDSKLDTFDKQVKLLASIPQYAPNEPELTIAALTTLYDTLKNENAKVIAQATAISNARLNRDQIMYHPETGMVATALNVKNYVKSVFGASSSNYKQISSIMFKNTK